MTATPAKTDRNFIIWALHEAGVRKAELARRFRISGDRVAKICWRIDSVLALGAKHPWASVDINRPPAWMTRLEAAGAIPRHPGMTFKERREDAIRRHLDRVVPVEPPLAPFTPPQWRLVVPSADGERTITRQYHAPFARSHSDIPASGRWRDRYIENWWYYFLLGWWLVGELHVRIINAADVTLAFGAKACRDEGSRLLERADFFDRELLNRGPR